MRENGPGLYALLADDPAAEHDIPALCAERGWHLQAAGEGRFAISVPALIPTTEQASPATRRRPQISLAAAGLAAAVRSR